MDWPSRAPRPCRCRRWAALRPRFHINGLCPPPAWDPGLHTLSTQLSAWGPRRSDPSSFMWLSWAALRLHWCLLYPQGTCLLLGAWVIRRRGLLGPVSPPTLLPHGRLGCRAHLRLFGVCFAGNRVGPPLTGGPSSGALWPRAAGLAGWGLHRAGLLGPHPRSLITAVTGFEKICLKLESGVGGAARLAPGPLLRPPHGGCSPRPLSRALPGPVSSLCIPSGCPPVTQDGPPVILPPVCSCRAERGEAHGEAAGGHGGRPSVSVGGRGEAPRPPWT